CPPPGAQPWRLSPALHRAGAAARADVQPAQAELVADDLRVVVLLAADRVPSPADDEPRIRLRGQDAGVAQDVEDRVRDAARRREIEAVAHQHVAVHVKEVAEHGKEMLADAPDHLPVHERTVRRVLELERDPADVTDHRDAEIAVAEQDLPDVVLLGPGIEHGQRALPPRLVPAAAARAPELVHLGAGKNLENALRRYQIGRASWREGV